MEAQGYSRRQFIEAMGAAALSSAATFYSHADDEKPKSHKEDEPVIIEIVPAGKDYIASNRGDYERQEPILVTDTQYSGDITPIIGLEGMLEEGRGPNPLQKDDPEEIEKRIKRICDDYIPNLATLLRITPGKSRYISLPGIFLTEEFILAPYTTVKTLDGPNTIQYVKFSENGSAHELSNKLQVFACSQIADLALLHTNQPKRHIKSPKISAFNPFQGEMLYGLYREFPLKEDIGGLLDIGGKIKPNDFMPLSSNSGSRLSGTNVILSAGMRYTICIGYATNRLQNNEKLKVEHFTDAMIKELNMPSPRGNIHHNVIPVLIRRDNGIVGSLILDSSGKLCGLTSLTSGYGNINYFISPRVIRGFLMQYQKAAKKK